jgi:hypothetical protein
MAYYSIFPDKDSTIYSHPDRKNINTGGDEILELVEEKSTTGNIYYPSRILLRFKNTEIQDIIENKLSGIAKEVTPNTCQINLQLFSTEHQYLNKEHIVEVYPLSQSWDEGTEKWTSFSPNEANGCTWIYNTDNTSSKWVTGSFGTGATGSFKNQAGGGTWYTGSDFRSENSFFNASNLDLDLDVTSIIQKFSASYYQDAQYPEGLLNHGFIIKQTLQEEENQAGFGYLKYFSVNTNTIYPPKLTFKWDDSSYSPTAGSTTLSSGDIFLSLYNNKAIFQRKSKQRFKLTTRKRYPDRTFVTSSNYLNTQYLPASSYYSVRDAETNEVIIPFDTEYTKLSANNEGMYFDLWMEGFQPERYYKIMFRTDNNDGIQIFDEDYFFKVIR